MAGQVEKTAVPVAAEGEAPAISNEPGDASGALFGQYLNLVKSEQFDACRYSTKDLGGNVAKSTESLHDAAERESMAHFIGFTMWDAGLEFTDDGFAITEADFAKAAHDPVIPMILRAQTDSLQYKLRGAAGPDGVLTQAEFSKYVVEGQNSDDLDDVFLPKAQAVMRKHDDMVAAVEAYDPNPLLGKGKEINKLTDRWLDDVFAPTKALKQQSEDCLDSMRQ